MKNKHKHIKRTNTPGSNWLYFKIYCGVRTADILLLEVLKDVLFGFVEENKVDQWFYIRYKDPDFHIRLRLHLKDTLYIGAIIKSVHDSLAHSVADNSIYKIQVDTYQRELERYGTTSIKLAELLFYNDSRFILNSLDLITDEEVLILVQLKNIDQLLDNFGFNRIEKLDFSVNYMDYYKKEHQVIKYTNKQLGQKFRERLNAIESFFNEDNSEEYGVLYKALALKTKRDKPIISQIVHLKKQKNYQSH